jgi:hypothetical protein
MNQSAYDQVSALDTGYILSRKHNKFIATLLDEDYGTSPQKHSSMLLEQMNLYKQCRMDYFESLREISGEVVDISERQNIRTSGTYPAVFAAGVRGFLRKTSVTRYELIKSLRVPDSDEYDLARQHRLWRKKNHGCFYNAQQLIDGLDMRNKRLLQVGTLLSVVVAIRRSTYKSPSMYNYAAEYIACLMIMYPQWNQQAEPMTRYTGYDIPPKWIQRLDKVEDGNHLVSVLDIALNKHNKQLQNSLESELKLRE